MPDNKEHINRVLQYDNLSASEIAKITGLSQPTVSRALKKMPALKLGGGRSTVFALVDSAEGIPIYQVGIQGSISLLGRLYQQPQGRTLVLCSTEYHCYEGLPFYLYDLLPSGFLGAITLRNITAHDSHLTTKSQDWSDAQILHYLTHYGDDLAGNLLLGRQMAEQASLRRYPVTNRSDYAEITDNINANPEYMQSSVAGEQPKFTPYNGQYHLIVKYSPLVQNDNPVATRHRDLMICEHLALHSLNQAGVTVSHSTLYFSDRFYLEIQRFDRIAEHGRRGMVSLKNIDAQYVGLNTSWPEIARSLLNQALIGPDDFLQVEITYAFGRYIANTDMHNGNFAFFMDGLSLAGATPIYDMLPMAFMPAQGELRNPRFEIPNFIDVSQQAIQKAQNAAIDFWNQVMQHPRISQEFKKQVKPIYTSLKAVQAVKLNYEVTKTRSF